MGNLMLWAVPFLRDVYGLGTTRAALYAMSTSLALLVSGADHRIRLRSRAQAAQASLHGARGGDVRDLGTLFVATLGVLPLWGVYAVLFCLGLAGSPSS